MVGVLGGSADDRWFASVLLGKELRKAEETREGDVVVHLVTAKDRSIGSILRLSKRHDFMPVQCVYFRNAAEDPSREFKQGSVFSQVRTSWTYDKLNERHLPTLVTIDSPREQPDAHAFQREFTYYWMDLDKVSHLLFDEDVMRERWETGESLLAAAQEAKSTKRKK